MVTCLPEHYCASKKKSPKTPHLHQMAAYPFGRQTRKEWLFSDEKLHYKVWLTSHRRNPPPSHPLAPETSSSPRPLPRNYISQSKDEDPVHSLRHGTRPQPRSGPRLNSSPVHRHGGGERWALQGGRCRQCTATVSQASYSSLIPD